MYHNDIFEALSSLWIQIISYKNMPIGSLPKHTKGIRFFRVNALNRSEVKDHFLLCVYYILYMVFILYVTPPCMR
jgi:hypothetical protein